jgi:hypothetical protein
MNTDERRYPPVSPAPPRRGKRPTMTCSRLCSVCNTPRTPSRHLMPQGRPVLALAADQGQAFAALGRTRERQVSGSTSSEPVPEPGRHLKAVTYVADERAAAYNKPEQTDLETRPRCHCSATTAPDVIQSLRHWSSAPSSPRARTAAAPTWSNCCRASPLSRVCRSPLGPVAPVHNMAAVRPGRADDRPAFSPLAACAGNRPCLTAWLPVPALAG